MCPQHEPGKNKSIPNLDRCRHPDLGAQEPAPCRDTVRIVAQYVAVRLYTSTALHMMLSASTASQTPGDTAPPERTYVSVLARPRTCGDETAEAPEERGARRPTAVRQQKHVGHGRCKSGFGNPYPSLRPSSYTPFFFASHGHGSGASPIAALVSFHRSIRQGKARGRRSAIDINLLRNSYGVHSHHQSVSRPRGRISNLYFVYGVHTYIHTCRLPTRSPPSTTSTAQALQSPVFRASAARWDRRPVSRPDSSVDQVSAHPRAYPSREYPVQSRAWNLRNNTSYLLPTRLCCTGLDEMDTTQNKVKGETFAGRAGQLQSGVGRASPLVSLGCGGPTQGWRTRIHTVAAPGFQDRKVVRRRRGPFCQTRACPRKLSWW